jgi:hypothetical protein
MPTPKEQVSATVDALIAKGRIQTGMRDQYITMLAGDDGLAQEFGGMLLMGNDYTKKTMDLADQRRQAQAEQQAHEARLTQERAALQDWQRTAQAEVERLRGLEAQYPELASKIAAYETTLKNYNLLDQAQIPPVASRSAAPFQAPAQTQPVQAPSDQYLTREAAAEFAQDLLRTQALGFQINNRHQQLFGEPLMEDVVGTALKAGQDPEAYWKTKYGVDQRLSVIDNEKRAKERAQIEAEVRAELMTKYSMDPSQIVGAPQMGSGQQSALAEAYMSSKAFAYNPLAEDGSRLAPEKVPDIVAHKNRVNEADIYFRQNFAPDGTPLLKGGAAS